MSPARHFEIIIGGRQLAGVIALVAVLLLVVFGLGVCVGLLEPRSERGAEFSQRSWQPAPPEPMPADGAFDPIATALPTATPDGRVVLAAEAELPPVIPSDIAAATPAAVASPSPEPLITPTPRPPRPTATALPKSSATPRPTAPPQFWIQVAAVSRPDQAEGLRQRVIAQGYRPNQVLVLAGTGGKYRVRLGPFPDQESAGRVVARLQESGFPDAYHLRE